MTLCRLIAVALLVSTMSAGAVAQQGPAASTPDTPPAATPAPEEPAPAAAEPAAPSEETPASESGTSAQMQLSLSTASYDGPSGSDDKCISAALLIGLGFSFDDTAGDVNPLGFGLGVRGGYHLDRLFLGGRFLYFAGGSSRLLTGEVSMSTWLLAAEGGYDFHLGELTLQPGLALGVAARDIDGPPAFIATSGVFPGTQSRTRLGLYVAPGASLIVPLSLIADGLDLFFIGGDARLDFVFGDEVSGSLQLLATAGARF